MGALTSWSRAILFSGIVSAAACGGESTSSKNVDATALDADTTTDGSTIDAAGDCAPNGQATIMDDGLGYELGPVDTVLLKYVSGQEWMVRLIKSPSSCSQNTGLGTRVLLHLCGGTVGGYEIVEPVGDWCWRTDMAHAQLFRDDVSYDDWALSGSVTLEGSTTAACVNGGFDVSFPDSGLITGTFTAWNCL